MVAALGGVLRIAEMFFHLDLQPGLEDLLGEVAPQPARADKVLAVGASLVDELLRERPIRPLLARVIGRCRHRHIMVCHGCLSIQQSKSLSISGQTSHTADLTVPCPRQVHELDVDGDASHSVDSARCRRPPSGSALKDLEYSLVCADDCSEQRRKGTR